MNRLILAAALALSACTTLPDSPSVVADETALDERTGLLVETLYSTATSAGTLAFRAGIIRPSVDPEVQRDDFCALVADYEPSDRGGEAMALECRLRAARDATRAAYDAGNATDYAAASDMAMSLARELLALIRGD